MPPAIEPKFFSCPEPEAGFSRPTQNIRISTYFQSFPTGSGRASQISPSRSRYSVQCCNFLIFVPFRPILSHFVSGIGGMTQFFGPLWNPWTDTKWSGMGRYVPFWSAHPGSIGPSPLNQALRRLTPTLSLCDQHDRVLCCLARGRCRVKAAVFSV